MLKLDSVSKRYGSKIILSQVILEVREGEFFAILGPSGSGKTTLLGFIAGIVPADSGLVFWRGEDMTRLAPNRRPCSYMFQNYALLPHLTVFENVAFPLAARNYAASGPAAKLPYLWNSPAKSIRQEQVHEVLAALALVKLEGYRDRRVQTLSGGEAQRVALARALVTRPSLLLMDEPLANLDRQLKLELRRELKRIQRETGVTVVYVTHDQEEAVTLADRLALIHNGAVAQTGKPSEILSNPSSDWVKGFFNKDNIVNLELLKILQ